jgi:predicted FMN-binding regulatory protein PaiB
MNAGPDRGKFDDDDFDDDEIDDEVGDDESDDTDSDEEYEDFEEDVGGQTVVMADDTFSETDISMEVNVEKLVAEFEKSQNRDARRKAEIRRRLEELAESRELEDTFAIDFDDED